MVVFTSKLLGLLVLSSLYSVAANPFKQHGSNVTWAPCAGRRPPLECATFEVPLDWGDKSQGFIPLSVIRLPASVQPRKGFMFYNPGGPGGSGVDFVSRSGSVLQKQIGASWDVVSWDPRGVGNSGPNITTFLTDQEYGQWAEQTQGLGHLDAHGNLTVQADVDFFMSQAPAFDEMAKTLNTIQQEKNGKNLTYIGSVAVVRDLVAMADAIYGHGVDINFWGISYGTVIGTYLTQLFPERVGHVILDGVYDPVAHSNQSPITWIGTDLLGVESAFTGWTEACAAAGPSKCTIAAKGNNTAEGIRKVFEDVLDAAYRNYDGTVWGIQDYFNTTRAAELDANPNHMSFAHIVTTVFGGLYDTQYWRFLNRLLEERTRPVNNSTILKQRSDESAVIPWGRIRPFYYGIGNVYPSMILKAAIYPIFCSDTIDPGGETVEDFFRAIVSASQQISRNFATGTLTGPRGYCSRFTTRAVERLPRNMDRKPKNVVLVIGNSADPITPFSSAQKVASAAHLGKKARLVKFNAAGHGSVSNNSTCIDEVVRKYLSGYPPADKGNDDADVECNADAGAPFG